MTAGRAAQRMTLFLCLLDGLVPLRIRELQGKPWLLSRAAQCADVIASRGDDLEHGGPNQGKALNEVVTALAILALTNHDGVTAFGGHWCLDHEGHS